MQSFQRSSIVLSQVFFSFLYFFFLFHTMYKEIQVWSENNEQCFRIKLQIIGTVEN